ncbi:putative lipoprotein YerB [Paraliobacillus quinghaiensis]|uniref:Lipoprotein YerB n=1 Tax=Paraliobacillus quinghaiensis TaxID=470815 RepID=A0A917WUH9_9BACI|nr:putative lipoprotein YerB [Paraliobacillus quinghaiensis]
MVLLSFLLIGLIACSNNTEETNSEPEMEPDPVEESEPESETEPKPEPKLPNVYPLTGERTDQEVDNRIVSVMVNNHPKARPQTGLSQADIVIEILAEYNITRFMALFQSEQPDVVGPVRSARPYYFNTADNYDALYVYHGAAGFIEDMLKNGAADYLNGAYYDNDGHLFERADFRVAPHNSYLQFDAVYEVAEKKGYEVTVNHEPLPFLEEDDEINGTAVSEISFNYTSTPVRYVYDAASEVYLRYNGEEQTVELDTEEAIQLDNVFLVETHHEVIDDSGRREVDLESGGNAYLLQKGTLQKIQWENRDGRIIPVRDGEEVGFVPGKTWINIIPEDPGLSGVEEIE